MYQIFPKVNQVFSYHLKNFEVINSLMTSVSLRVDAQQQYQKAINKSVQKISQLETDHPLYSKIIRAFRSLITQRAHQIRFFKQQLAQEAQILKNALTPVEEEMRGYLSELKGMQKDLKTSFDSMTKSKNNSQQRIKELDEKFILNEVTVLFKENKGQRKNSQGYLDQQKKLLKSLKKQWESVHQKMTTFESGAQQKQKKIWQLDVKVQEEFVDFFKKLNVHEISLIRNIQYDIDTMIKKTDIFNWQNTNEFKEQFSGNDVEQLSLEVSDPYVKFKKALLSQNQLIDPSPQSQCDQQKLAKLKQKLSNQKENQEAIQVIKKNYGQNRAEICEWIESFRKSGHFKFEAQQFETTVIAFRQILRVAIACLDFQCVQKIILFGNSYFILGTDHKKRTVLDELKNQKDLGDLTFWKFYLLWTIRNSIASCKINQDRQMHLRNSVYSTLLSSGLNMVEFGIQKHSIKNLVGKLAKTFASITEAQVAELLKIVEITYENREKSKKNKKE